jgi:hypothetical protein
MLSNLSDLLFSRVDPDPVQSQSSMVAMSPQSQAQATSQAPAQAKYLQAGQPVKQFNAMTANMSAGNPTGDEESVYKQFLKGKYGGGTPEQNKTGIYNADGSMKYSTPEEDYRRGMVEAGLKGEDLYKKLYEKERITAFREDLMKQGKSRKQIDEAAVKYLKEIQSAPPTAW